MNADFAATTDPPRDNRSHSPRVAITLLLSVGALLSVVLGVYLGWTALDAGPLTQCSETVTLTPTEMPGLPWARHRHGLLASGSYQGTGHDYVIEDLNTGRSFHWLYAYTDDGQTRFAVPTHYAEFLNRHWRDDQWVFCRVVGNVALSPP
ncbi:MAG: hypothetical protein ACR2PL_13985, partial [Dehalococcoidia bacterium]